MFFLRMAWRNLFRNGRRTLLTASIVAMGLGGLILADAIALGMTRLMASTATDLFLGQGQVHAEGFRSSLKVEKTVENLPRVEALLQGDPSVACFAERSCALVMISSGWGAESALLHGIDPAAERRVSRLQSSLTAGRNLLGPGDEGVLLGERLARALHVGVGDRVVVTCSRKGGGDLAQAMMKVTGIFAFHSKGMDRSLAFTGLAHSQQLLGLGAGVHEVAVRFKEGDGSERTLVPLYRSLSQGGNEALPWSALMPQLKMVIDISRLVAYILSLLLTVLVALSIWNTLFMSLYERTYEFGVLRALGTRPAALSALVLMESACLGFVSVLLGTLAGWGATQLMTWIGLDYRGIEYAGITYQTVIVPQARMIQYTLFPLGVWCFTILISLYPAIHAARISPVRAMQRSLG